MISANGKKLNKIINMGVSIIKNPGSDLIELWINNVFICQGDNMYINHNIEDTAYITTYYPDDEVSVEEKKQFFTETEDLPFN